MSLFLSLLLLIAGFVLLIKGADWLVEGASALARTIGASDLMIGLTIVAFGTSMPELLVNVIASAQGNADIAIGNVVGSNIANTFLALGAAALIAPLYVRGSTVRKEIPFSLLATVILLVLVNDTFLNGSFAVSQISRSEGMVLIGFFIIFIYYTFGIEPVKDGHSERKIPIPLAVLYIILGCIMLPLGGKLAVDASVSIATSLGVSEALIGLSLVALGTSLPEVVTACVAAYRGKVDIAVGNVIGSNIFNILWILGVSAIIRPIVFNPVLNTDMLIALFASVLLLFFIYNGHIYQKIFFLWHKKKEYVLVKYEGVMLLLGYVAYIVYIGWRG